MRSRSARAGKKLPMAGSGIYSPSGVYRLPVIFSSQGNADLANDGRARGLGNSLLAAHWLGVFTPDGLVTNFCGLNSS